MDIDKVTMAPYTTLDYAKDLVKVTQGRCDMEQVNCLTKNSNDTLKWMVGHGCKFTLALGKVRRSNTSARATACAHISSSIWTTLAPTPVLSLSSP